MSWNEHEHRVNMRLKAANRERKRLALSRSKTMRGHRPAPDQVDTGLVHRVYKKLKGAK